MAERRFEVAHKEGMLTQAKIVVDKLTGVNYLFIAEGGAGGVTPLLDKDGKVVVSDLGRRQY